MRLNPSSHSMVSAPSSSVSVSSSSSSSSSSRANSHRFRSRFSSKPGSRHTHQVNFRSSEAAFDASEIPMQVREAKHRTLLDLQPKSLLGKRPDWNVSTDLGKKPVDDRAMVRTLSEYQSIPFTYNYRAEVLPDTHRTHVYVPKCSKFSLDRSLLLSKKDSSHVVDKIVCVNTHQSIDIHPELTSKPEWNMSSVTSIPRKIDDFSPLPGTKRSYKLRGYSNPVTREKQFVESIREQKRLKAEDERKRQEEESMFKELQNSLY